MRQTPEWLERAASTNLVPLVSGESNVDYTHVTYYSPFGAPEV